MNQLSQSNYLHLADPAGQDMDDTESKMASPTSRPNLRILYFEASDDNGSACFTTDPFEAGNIAYHHGMLDCYRLLNRMLYQSYMELCKLTSRNTEVRFWKSRRADYYVSLWSEMREQLGYSPVSANRLRKGLSIKLGYGPDWLMPEDDMSQDELDDHLAKWAKKLESVRQAFPDGVADEASDRMFEPTRNSESKPTPATPRKRQSTRSHSRSQQLEILYPHFVPDPTLPSLYAVTTRDR